MSLRRPDPGTFEHLLGEVRIPANTLACSAIQVPQDRAVLVRWSLSIRRARSKAAWQRWHVRSDSKDASYLDLAEFIASKQGVEGKIDQELRELFQRVMFNVTVANRDDHLRNHGFTREAAGWRLAPPMT